MAHNQEATPPMVNGIVDHELPYDTHNTYDVIFFGKSVHTTVACDPTIVTQWISDIESLHRQRLQNLIVGLDIEWRPSYNRYINNPAATIQLCVGRRCLIFQLIHSPSIPQSLINFLANPNYKFVGIGVKQDLEKLEDYEFGFNTNTVDLRELAVAKYGQRELKNSGLKRLASLVLEKEVEMPKSVTMSQWDNLWLTPSQVRYACVDAFLSFEIGRVLMASPASISATSASPSISATSASPSISASSKPNPLRQPYETETATAVMAHNQEATPPMVNGIVDHELPYDTHNTYDVIFFGESVHTTVACDPTIVTQWISDIESLHRQRLQNLIVGLDIEWRPSFNRYINNPAATIQLCVGRRCLIFQLIHSPSIPQSIINFLANPNYKFVGIGVKQDLEKLEEDYEFGFNTNTVDLRELAVAKYGQRELKNSGLKRLASLVLEKEVEKPKSVTMSRWDNLWLTPSQVRYACVDAFLSFEIGRVLMASPASISATSASRSISASATSASR